MRAINGSHDEHSKYMFAAYETEREARERETRRTKRGDQVRRELESAA